MTEIIFPSISQSKQLSDIAFESKAHWGYSEEFMEQCRDELRVSESDIENGMIRIAKNEEAVAGFYKLEGRPPIGELAMLFVHPDYIGLGLGRVLLNAAKEQAASIGMDALEIESDPNAESFYIHMGATKIGEIESGSIPGRILPKLLLRTK